MTAARAWLGSIAFLLVAPGTVAGIAPWLVGGWRFHSWPGTPIAAPVGATLVLSGTAVVLHAFVAFATRGVGTPAPVAPPRHLVVSGAYRHVRNPMYVALLAVIVGQALVFGDLRIAVYGAGVFAAFAGFVHLYEEPTLRRRFGADYARYVANVPRWIPRLTPWYPEAEGA